MFLLYCAMLYASYAAYMMVYILVIFIVMVDGYDMDIISYEISHDIWR